VLAPVLAPHRAHVYSRVAFMVSLNLLPISLPLSEKVSMEQSLSLICLSSLSSVLVSTPWFVSRIDGQIQRMQRKFDVAFAFRSLSFQVLVSLLCLSMCLRKI